MKPFAERVAAADIALSRRIATTRDPLLDATMPHLSNTANHSKIWVAAAAALALAGDRQSRRAAQRGLLSVGLASAVTNLLLKPMLPRPRPLHHDEPIFPFVRRPTSSSFPSGHAASAAAFATAAAMESPMLAAPIAALAAAVGYSRVSTGVHYAGDVVVGAVVGAGVAVATTRLWPLVDQSPATARPTPTQRQGVVSDDGEGLTLVVNAAAGPSAHESELDELRQELPAATIVEVGDPDDLADAFAKAAASARVLGVFGGDGTVNSAASAAIEADVPLAVFPGGTLNHFARDLGVDTMADAISAIQQGHLVEVDTATIDNRLFLNTASLGSYSDLVEAREQLEDRIGKWPALVVALAQVLRHGEPCPIEIDGVPKKVWMVFVGNCEYDPPGFAPAARQRLDDGLLDVRLVEGSTPYARARLLLAVLTGRLARSTVYTRRLVRRLDVRAETDPTMLAADGEIFEGCPAFSIAKNPRPLIAYAPHR